MPTIVGVLPALAAGGGTVFIHVFPPSVERSMVRDVTTRHLLSGFDGDVDSVSAICLLTEKRCAAEAGDPARESAASPGEAPPSGGAEGGAAGASATAAGAFAASGSARSR